MNRAWEAMFRSGDIRNWARDRRNSLSGLVVSPSLLFSKPLMTHPFRSSQNSG